MGFNLKEMIEELESILLSQQIRPEQAVEELRLALAYWKKYADECGQLK